MDLVVVLTKHGCWRDGRWRLFQGSVYGGPFRSSAGYAFHVAAFSRCSFVVVAAFSGTVAGVSSLQLRWQRGDHGWQLAMQAK